MDNEKSQEVASKKKRKTVWIWVCLLILAVIACGTGYELLRVYGSNHTYTDLDTYLGPRSSDQWTLLLNENITGQYAIMEGETLYLPLAYLSESLDDRLYFDSDLSALLYTLPNEIVAAALDELSYTQGDVVVSTDAASLICVDGVYYVSLDFIRTFSDCLWETNEEDRIIWLWNDFENSYPTANVDNEGEKMRVSASIQSEIVKKLVEGEIVYTLWQDGSYTYCIAENGLMGYVRTDELVASESWIKESQKEATEYSSISIDGYVRMGWHQMDEYNYTSQVDRLVELTSTATGLNVISPTWYSISGADGSVTSFASVEYVQKAHELGIQVWALVDNFNTEVDNYALFSSYYARKNLIDRLVGDALEYGFDGINIDFEAGSTGYGSIDSDTGVHFVEFIRELSISCRNAGIILSVDNHVPTSYNEYYNLSAQGEASDYVIVMCYDEHYAGSETSGSVASYDFVKSGIEDTVEDVPAEKVICAIPFYTRVWQVDEFGNVLSSEAKGVSAMESFLEEQGLEAIWLDDVQQNYVSYELEGSMYEVWIEDLDSLSWKLDLVEQYDIAGVSAWRLGLETGEYWDEICGRLE